jgi:hypothetical protein
MANDGGGILYLPITFTGNTEILRENDVNKGIIQQEKVMIPSFICTYICIYIYIYRGMHICMSVCYTQRMNIMM